MGIKQYFKDRRQRWREEKDQKVYDEICRLSRKFSSQDVTRTAFTQLLIRNSRMQDLDALSNLMGRVGHQRERENLDAKRRGLTEPHE